MPITLQSMVLCIGMTALSQIAAAAGAAAASADRVLLLTRDGLHPAPASAVL